MSNVVKFGFVWCDQKVYGLILYMFFICVFWGGSPNKAKEKKKLTQTHKKKNHSLGIQLPSEKVFNLLKTPQFPSS